MNSRKNIDIILFEDNQVLNFYPLIETRPVGELRTGIFTNTERWSRYIQGEIAHSTREYLREMYPMSAQTDVVYVNSRVIPNYRLVETISDIASGQALFQGDLLIASREKPELATEFERVEYSEELLLLNGITDLFSKNDQIIRLDFEHYRHKKSAVLPIGNTLIGSESELYLSPDAKVNASIINTETGPVFIGSGAEIMEGSMIRGPFVLGDHSTLKMGAKIYGATTIGPHCKVGGEVSNSVFTGYSNKAHDGFLGNSVLGEWCNLGADSNNSNLKNNYGSVTLWNAASGTFEDTGLTFCGLMMGDHSKCGINTMFNTGTVVGTACNLFGGNYMPRFIPSFSWGGSESLVEHDFEKAMETANRVLARRQMELDEVYKSLLREVFLNSRRFHTDKSKS
jgi:UDP-N-acetylglucosamine diphosphorylase/glucosamine-1-phosphate N-acetyltransferase